MILIFTSGGEGLQSGGMKKILWMVALSAGFSLGQEVSEPKKNKVVIKGKKLVVETNGGKVLVQDGKGGVIQGKIPKKRLTMMQRVKTDHEKALKKRVAVLEKEIEGAKGKSEVVEGLKKELAALQKQRVEVGTVRWGRDLDGAFKKSKASGKPVFLLFQEVPG